MLGMLPRQTTISSYLETCLHAGHASKADHNQFMPREMSACWACFHRQTTISSRLATNGTWTRPSTPTQCRCVHAHIRMKRGNAHLLLSNKTARTYASAQSAAMEKSICCTRLRAFCCPPSTHVKAAGAAAYCAQPSSTRQKRYEASTVTLKPYALCLEGMLAWPWV